MESQFPKKCQQFTAPKGDGQRQNQRSLSAVPEPAAQSHSAADNHRPVAKRGNGVKQMVKKGCAYTHQQGVNTGVEPNHGIAGNDVFSQSAEKREI